MRDRSHKSRHNFKSIHIFSAINLNYFHDFIEKNKKWGDEKRKKGIKKVLPLFECGKLQDLIKSWASLVLA
jgi:hypothetical protein